MQIILDLELRILVFNILICIPMSHKIFRLKIYFKNSSLNNIKFSIERKVRFYVNESNQKVELFKIEKLKK